MSILDLIGGRTVTKVDDGDNIIKMVISNNYRGLIHSTANFNTIKDTYNNNLLHIAALFHSNANIIKLLLERSVDTDHKNIRNELPIDIAVNQHNAEFIKEYYRTITNANDSLHTEVMTLRERVTYFQTKSQRLDTDNNIISSSLKTVTTENDILRTNNKRLRDENTHLICTNKDLTEQNKRLKTSVETLTNLNKK